VNLYHRGYRNATQIAVRGIEVDFSKLPDTFDKYRVIHLSDLHLDGDYRIEELICERIRNLEYDLCVLTGDYRQKTHGTFRQMLEPMEKIAKTTKAKDGILAVLGNHDSYLMVDSLEDMGIKVLSNETMTIHRGNEKIAVTGIDDPNYYYTDQAMRALEEPRDGFKIVLVHTPELFDVAADNGYGLYLCGHTHGGQICLPGGIPLITHLNCARKYYRGLWRHADMKGYTSQGTGTVGIPIRFNSQSEIALITLMKKASRRDKQKERLAVLRHA
jgi:predicted MPP superfamily phosphohydrolase